MRTTVTLDDDVVQAVQAMSKASGRRLGEVLSLLVRRALEGETQWASRTRTLPVFPVGSNAELIPAARATKLLADELP